MRRTLTSLTLLLAVAALGVAALGVWRVATALPEGPEEVAWDKTACAECRMHVGDRRFAAQLQAIDGRVLDFDDPGCLLGYLTHEGAPVHALWFHHSREERWLSAEQVGFLPGAQTPMGHGLAAVDAATPGALTLKQARGRFAKETADAR